jgi:hypothetical protein
MMDKRIHASAQLNWMRGVFMGRDAAYQLSEPQDCGMIGDWPQAGFGGLSFLFTGLMETSVCAFVKRKHRIGRPVRRLRFTLHVLPRATGDGRAARSFQLSALPRSKPRSYSRPAF